MRLRLVPGVGELLTVASRDGSPVFEGPLLVLFLLRKHAFAVWCLVLGEIR
jgi:hypothetical protein